jgi:hypothetical protein
MPLVQLLEEVNGARCVSLFDQKHQVTKNTSELSMEMVVVQR